MSESLLYIASADQILEGVTYVLPYESKRLHGQVEGIRGKRRGIAGHITEAMEQTSETWHDNAPAEALFSEMYQLDVKEARLIRAARTIIEVPYPTAEVGFVTIGSRVLCDMQGDEFLLDITGNLPLSRDNIDHDEVERGSIAAPMPRSLLGARTKDDIKIDLQSRVLQLKVVSIDQNAQRLAYDNHG